MGRRGHRPQGEFTGPRPMRKKKPRDTGVRGAEREIGTYFLAKTCFATWALARLAALRCTTPDLTALSMAEV